jgi:thiamine-phosphate pyrophosphorylase
MALDGLPEALPRLHVVTDDATLARAGFEGDALALLTELGSGVALHLRGPGTDGRSLYERAVALAPAARRSGALLLVNDRVDVALASGAQGVQLGERSMFPADARALLGPGRWVGASVHGVERARACVASGADFLLAGTIFPTRSHPGQEGAGTARVRRIAGAVGVPVLGIGGMDAATVGPVMEAGAWGVAALGAVWRFVAGPVAGARALRRALSNYLEIP